MSAKALFSKFSSLTDKRDLKKSTHILAEVMFMSVCAILCGADDWNSIRLFAGNYLLKPFFRLQKTIFELSLADA